MASLAERVAEYGRSKGLGFFGGWNWPPELEEALRNAKTVDEAVYGFGTRQITVLEFSDGSRLSKDEDTAGEDFTHVEVLAGDIDVASYIRDHVEQY